MNTRDHGLNQQTIREIEDVLARFPAVETALLFGSRAKGNYKIGSDIDLALVGPEINWNTLGGIYAAFDDTSLPYKFSLVRRWRGGAFRSAGGFPAGGEGEMQFAVAG